MQKDRKALVALLGDSLPSFATLFRHAALLAGGVPHMKKRDVFSTRGPIWAVQLASLRTLAGMSSSLPKCS